MTYDAIKNKKIIQIVFLLIMSFPLLYLTYLTYLAFPSIVLWILSIVVSLVLSYILFTNKTIDENLNVTLRIFKIILIVFLLTMLFPLLYLTSPSIVMWILSIVVLLMLSYILFNNKTIDENLNITLRVLKIIQIVFLLTVSSLLLVLIYLTFPSIVLWILSIVVWILSYILFNNKTIDENLNITPRVLKIIRILFLLIMSSPLLYLMYLEFPSIVVWILSIEVVWILSYILFINKKINENLNITLRVLKIILIVFLLTVLYPLLYLTSRSIVEWVLSIVVVWILSYILFNNKTIDENLNIILRVFKLVYSTILMLVLIIGTLLYLKTYEPFADPIAKARSWLENPHDIQDIKGFVRSGSDVNATGGSYNKTALMWTSDTEVAKYLIEAGAGVNLKDTKGWSALRYACRDGDYTMVKLLIDAGADINTKDNNGMSVLEYAYKNEKHAMIKLLLDAGAKPILDNKNKEKSH